MDGTDKGERGRRKVGEQVTIVRIAIEEILEKAIDPRFSCPCVYAHTYIRVCTNHVFVRTHMQGALVRPPTFLVETALRSKQHCGLTLDISEAGHARTRCLPMVSPAASKF